MCQIIQERYKQEYDKGFKDAQDAANEKFVLITQAMNAAKDEARTAKDEAKNIQHNAVLSLRKYGNLTIHEIAQTLAIPFEAVEEIVNSQTS